MKRLSPISPADASKPPGFAFKGAGGMGRACSPLAGECHLAHSAYRGWERPTIGSSVELAADHASAAGANWEFQVSDIAGRVKEIVREYLALGEGMVTESARIENDLGADSLDIIELVMAFEEEFDVHIPSSATEAIQTVGDAVTVIESASRVSHR